MEDTQRMITLHTPTKIYSGLIDVGNASLRTIDIFNSANIYWKNPNEKSFNDALLLHNAKVMLEGGTKLGEYSSLQVKLSDVYFFFDTLERSGDNKERMRAETLKGKTREETSSARIITQTRGDTFFYIQGLFHGLFKSKSKQRFIPIPEATITAIVREDGRWQKRKVEVKNNFVGVSTQHIEACTFSRNPV